MNAGKQILTELELENSFKINKTENLHFDISEPKRVIYNQIILVENGTGILIIDGNSYSFNKNVIFLIGKGQILQFEQSSKFSGYTLAFGDCFWERAPQSASNCKAVLFNNISANQRLTLTNSEANEVQSVFAMAFKDYSSEEYINQLDALAAYLKIIMIKIANIKITEEATFNSQDYIAYRHFMDILNKDFRAIHSVNEYAEKLNMTARRLSELCKRCSGLNAKEIINGNLLSEAKRSLQFGSDSVKEIAYALNFNTPEEFSHFFKKHTKASPLAYRKQFLDMGR